ncbi:MAG: DnaJ domain-containing protein [Alphaproteobacteria bacterium]|nr:DnaJ domain-containing protein [Alphaproteobacteria bacterium]
MKKKQRSRKYYNPQREDTVKKCDHPNCSKLGEYKAPKDRDLKAYYWFCLEHVQEYNAKWNYYEGISTDEPVEEEPFSHHRFKGFKSKVKYNNFAYGYEAFDDYNNDFSGFYTREEKKYFEIMEIKPSEVSIKLIKKQYKILAKKYHPDLNQGDKEMEEKFKSLSLAYNYLLNKFS